MGKEPSQLNNSFVFYKVIRRKKPEMKQKATKKKQTKRNKQKTPPKIPTVILIIPISKCCDAEACKVHGFVLPLIFTP